MGTPTAHVSFGPLRELIDSPELPQDWDPLRMADHCQQLLQDPSWPEKISSVSLLAVGASFGVRLQPI